MLPTWRYLRQAKGTVRMLPIWDKTIGQVPETLKVLVQKIARVKILLMEVLVTGPPIDASDGKWVLGRSIEILYSCKTYKLKDQKASYEKSFEMLCKLYATIGLEILKSKFFFCCHAQDIDPWAYFLGRSYYQDEFFTSDKMGLYPGGLTFKI